MSRDTRLPAAFLVIASSLVAMISLSCASLAPAKGDSAQGTSGLALGKNGAEIVTERAELEVGQRLPLSLRLRMPGGAPSIAWSADSGTIEPTSIDNEVDFLAPDKPGEVTVVASASAKGKTLKAELKLKVLAVGALKKTAEVIVEVDCNSLKKVWVDDSHPAENFAAPLKIKGTFSLDVDTGEASAGGSWPSYDMYDDGSHGDRVAGDGVWTERFVFPKSTTKVYFAFDDANAYRVGFESGLAWRLKLAWRGVDEAGAGEVSDANNLFFVPEKDQTVRWTAEMAAVSGMYSEAAK